MLLRLTSCIFLFISLIAPVFAQEQVQINTPYVSTPPAVVLEMLQLARPKATDVIYDLGCGDGRIVIEAAKRYGARGVGVDNNPDRIREAQENARREGVSHLVEFRIADLYETDLQRATIVALYLLPDVNLRLRPKLKSELPHGARIVSHNFGMGDWKPKKTRTVDGETVFLWKIRHAWLF